MAGCNQVPTQRKADPHSLDRARDGLAGRRSLGGGDGSDLLRGVSFNDPAARGGGSENSRSTHSTDERERGRDEHGKETQEAAPFTRYTVVLNETLRLIPEAEADRLVVGPTAGGDDDGDDDETDNGNDLDGRGPKLHFTEGAGTEEVDQELGSQY